MIIPANRRAILLNLSMLAAVEALFYWLSVRKSPHGGLVMSILAAFLVYMLWPSIRSFFTGVAVVLTDRGIVNFTGGVTFVAWDELKGAHVVSPWGLKQVELVLTDRDVVLRRVGGVRGWSLRKYVEKYGGAPSIHAYFAQGGGEAVLRAISKKRGILSDAV